MQNKIDELKQVLKNKKDVEHAKQAEESEGHLDKESADKIIKDLSAKLQNQTEELNGVQKESKEHQDKYIRLYAEFENYRRRAQKEKEDLARYAHEQVIKELLPVLDDLERALTHAEQSKDLKSLIEGIHLVERQLLSNLERFGLKAFSAIGEVFNPHLHEAMAHQESTKHPADTVISEYRKGYTLHGKLVRPALVAVAKSPEVTQEFVPDEKGPSNTH